LTKDRPPPVDGKLRYVVVDIVVAVKPPYNLVPPDTSNA
jgi:hypothetical protein